jgi:hypothetical protein
VTRWLIIGLCAALPATAAGAQSTFGNLSHITADDFAAARVPNLRLVDAEPAAPGRRFGMVVEREVAPNAHLGLGLMNSTKRPATSDWRLERRTYKSRKLGLSFQMQF